MGLVTIEQLTVKEASSGKTLKFYKNEEGILFQPSVIPKVVKLYSHGPFPFTTTTYYHNVLDLDIKLFEYVLIFIRVTPPSITPAITVKTQKFTEGNIFESEDSPDSSTGYLTPTLIDTNKPAHVYYMYASYAEYASKMDVRVELGILSGGTSATGLIELYGE